MKKITHDTTTDSRTYRLVSRQLRVFGCLYCGPHSGCNRRSKRFGKNDNWKGYRRTRWKPKDM